MTDERNDIEQDLEAMNRGQDADPYGIEAKEMEVDSDVNEDRDRERQLDVSYDDWYSSVADSVLRREQLTEVPRENVFDVAEGLDDDTSS